jgi:tetratricopeptide (TPR) repeat protein
MIPEHVMNLSRKGRRRQLRAVLSASTASLALLVAAGLPAAACPLGDHDSPRVRLLHGLGGAGHHGHHSGTRTQLAQSHPQTRMPARNELGAYARDLPRGAAAPTNEDKPPLFGNLGTLSWDVADTRNPQAKAYFDQGYRLAWGFNHAEAARAFRAAQALDPQCAMCLWGEAWVLGPHINYPVEADANARAVAVLDQARRLVSRRDDMQAALINALAKRYSADAKADRKALDQAYADAMEAAQARFPTDANVALLTADALMNLSPWDYWADNGRTPKGATERIIALIEGVLGERRLGALVAEPNHPGAIHLYIHAVEASDRPERAAPHAERLAALMPGAGHLVHMPSHIWYRLGRWRDSLEANIQAAAADEQLLQKGGASLLYSQGYFAHNVHFIMASALMGGDGETAVKAAQKLAAVVSDRAMREVPWSQPIAAAPYSAHARFSAPQAVLALPAPDGAFPFVRATWHYARGVALARLGEAEAASAEAAVIRDLARTPEIAALGEAGVPGPDVLAIAGRVIEARIAQAGGDHARAASLFAEAAATQDKLPYMEPPFWYYPVHQSLGASLLLQGKTDEAEAAFRAALQRSPNNGWAAAGLLRAAETRGHASAVEAARTLLQKNWFGESVPELDQL